jgi:hypothetical protein
MKCTPPGRLTNIFAKAASPVSAASTVIIHERLIPIADEQSLVA